MKKRWLMVMMIAWTGMLSGCGGGAQPENVDKAQGVSSSPGVVETVPKLTELRRITQDEAWDPDANITDVAPVPGPNLYLVDTRLMRVFVVGPDGNVLHRFLKKGQGPGEFQYYPRFQRLGDDLWIHEYQKLDRFSLDGVLQEETRQKKSYQNLTMVDGNRFVGVLETAVGDAKTGKRIKRAGMWDRQENQLKVFRESEKRGRFEFRDGQIYLTVSFGGGLVPDLITATDPARGLVYICETDRYRVDVLDLEGNPVRTIERTVTVPPFTDEDKNALVDNFKVSGVDQRTLKAELKKKLPDVMQPVSRLTVTQDGWLLVFRPLNREDAVVDVYDPDGRLRAIWKSPTGVDLEAATFFTHDHIAVVDDSGDMPVVIVYRLK